MSSRHALAALALLSGIGLAAPAPPQEREPPPVLRLRTVRFAEGREVEASELWSRFGSHFTAHYSPTVHGWTAGRVQVSLSRLGTFAEADRAMGELERDEGWRALLEQADGRLLEDRTVLLFPLGGRPFEPAGEVSFLRTTRSPASKAPLARAFAKRVTDHLDAAYEGLQACAMSPAVDDPTVIHWIFQYADHAAFETIQRSLLEDEDYLGLYRRAEGLFLDEETSEVRLTE
jgi:hypothetical protein